MKNKKKNDDPIHSRMRKYVNRHMSNLFKRTVYILLFATIQIALLVVSFTYLGNLTPYFWTFCTIISLIQAMHILNKNNNPAYKIAWLIPILVVPIFGGLLYLMFGSKRVNKRLTAVTNDIQKKYAEFSPCVVPSIEKKIAKEAPRNVVLQSSYISRASGCLPYGNTQTKYFPSGEELFPVMYEALKQAKQYIFIEYFIIEEGLFWGSILDILTEKVKEGVEVRVMYDDFGSMLTLPLNYDKMLRERGIKCHVFNPFNTVLHPRPNNRDHRKIAVIDGKTAFVGGINLADEYINTFEKHGYWKDTALQMIGDAAWGCTIQFLCVWDADTHDKTDFTKYTPCLSNEEKPLISDQSIVQPYTDIPMDNEQVGESVYFQMITRAEKYIYITTPYLIIDYEMQTALQIAAKSGVDVRIITPHIPDKKIVFFLTRSYYKPLMDAGVKIYEFTPGFIHAKSMVSDDRFAVVGSINLDYRSLYLHLENGVWMYNTEVISDIRDDFLATQEKSQLVTEELLGRLTLPKRMWLSILRTFSPLL